MCSVLGADVGVEQLADEITKTYVKVVLVFEMQSAEHFLG